MFGSVGEGVATVDADGKVLKINPALERLVGKTECARSRARRGQSTFVLCDERGMALAWEDTVVAEAIQRRHVVASRGYALGLETADGRRLPVAVTAAPLVVDTATPPGRWWCCVTCRASGRSISSSPHWCRRCSHELRTPLTLIQGFSELLLARPDLGQDRSRDALHEIHVSSQRLGRLIDDLLSVSRIESGRLTADFETFDLSRGDLRSAGVVLDRLGSPLRHRCCTSTCDPSWRTGTRRSRSSPTWCPMPSKYSPPGSEVRIVARSVDNHAEVQVIDHGIGMTEAERAEVFEKFSRSRPARGAQGGWDRPRPLHHEEPRRDAGRPAVAAQRSGRGNHGVVHRAPGRLDESRRNSGRVRDARTGQRNRSR